VPVPDSSNHSKIEQAIEAFILGLCSCRSFTHPFVPQRVGPLWVARDGPRKSGNCRNEEWAAFGVNPMEADRIIRNAARGRFAICQIHPTGESDELMRKEYKELAYGLQTTEPLMAHNLKRIPTFAPPANIKIERVTTQPLADRLAKVTRSRQILPEHFENQKVRQYIALAGDKIVGWVRSVSAGDSRWCSNMHVLPAFRRRGIARAMLSQMLRDDRQASAKGNVLTSSHVGALLYPLLGYEQLATLYVYKLSRK
jgi:ribosomal protein S18 acetylase RimI-like enzyme